MADFPAHVQEIVEHLHRVIDEPVTVEVEQRWFVRARNAKGYVIDVRNLPA